jgi:hypothetical protein
MAIATSKKRFVPAPTVTFSEADPVAATEALLSKRTAAAAGAAGRSKRVAAATR